MISFQGVSIHFGTQDVLKGVSFKINRGERVGIVGPNGAGKSTIFNLITSEVSPEKGDIVFEGLKPTLGHLHQQLNFFDSEDTLLSYTLRSSKKIKELENQILLLESSLNQITDATEREKTLNRIGLLQTEFEHLGGYDLETRVKEALGGLGFHQSDFNRPFSEFSGGWKMRAEMVRTFVSKPDVLMLDEPSNYLDLPAVEWMQRYLRDFQGTLLLISHDRYLLKTLTNVTIEVDGGIATRYNGGYDYYLRERVARYETLLAAKRNQDRLRDQMQRFIDTFRYTPSKAPQVQSRIKMLEKMEEIVVPKQASTQGNLRLPEFHHCGTTVVNAKNVGFSYDGEKWIFENLDLEVSRGEHLAIVGFNGMGKTTFSRLLSGRRQPSKGELILGHKVVPGYVSQEFSETIPFERSLINVIKTANDKLTEAECRTFLGGFGFSGDDAFKAAGVLSGGEKIRLAFAAMCAEKPNFLILDEPTTHLDINGRKSLEDALKGYEGTIVVVSHDVEFVKNVATSILAIDDNGFKKYNCGYNDYREIFLRDESKRATSSIISTSQDDREQEDSQKQLSKKELRKQRSDEREKKMALVRPLKKKIIDFENKISTLEEEQEMLLNEMSSNEKADFAMINRRLAEIQRDLIFYTDEWEKVSLELEEIEKEFTN